MKKRLTTYILILLLVFTVFGCGDEPVNQAPAKAKKTVKAKKPAPVPDVVVADQAEKVYTYNPIGKRDPFENPLQAIVELAPESGVPLTPLQKFDLGQLRLIGVIIGKGKPRAMVIAPDGKSFILNVGTKVGKNNGAVIDITTDAVLVKENYSDFTGEIKTSIQEIRLPKQGGVK